MSEIPPDEASGLAAAKRDAEAKRDVEAETEASLEPEAEGEL